MSRPSVALTLALIALLVSWVTLVRAAPSGQKKDSKQVAISRLTIELTGGDEKKPIADASVYLKYVMVVKHGRDQKLELNLKTNEEGVTHSPEIPQGKVLIQVVAQGWKTFGQYYDVQEDDQTVQIHLERPATKWY